MVASVEAKFPLSNLGVTSTSVVPVWGESDPSPSLKSNVKDIVPNSGTMILDLGTGLWAPDGSVPGLIDISKRVDQATVAGSGVVTYTIDLVNVGGSAATSSRGHYPGVTRSQSFRVTVPNKPAEVYSKQGAGDYWCGVSWK